GQTSATKRTVSARVFADMIGRAMGPKGAALEGTVQDQPVELLDVVLGYDCNLACTYCTITDEMRRRAMPTERVAREIDPAARRGFQDIAFTGGEPTIRSDLPTLVRYAKKRGFSRVKVASNGLRYAHAPYLDHLLDAGVNQWSVSMHAPS